LLTSKDIEYIKSAQKLKIYVYPSILTKFITVMQDKSSWIYQSGGFLLLFPLYLI